MGGVPVPECARIGIALTDALEFLHRQGLTHRDIKPQNVIFVNGRPKLADLGLVAEIRPLETSRRLSARLAICPRRRNCPGTPQADIYAAGMLLYVISTGRGAAFFPEIATTLVERKRSGGFFQLNAIILKACQPNPAHRYGSAAEMHEALKKVK